MSQLDIDIQEFKATFPLTDELRGARVCITGSTGLIGSMLVRCLLALDADITLLLPVRNIRKARTMFADGLQHIELEETPDLTAWTKTLDSDIDYIVHCASPTAGSFMTEHPVETFTLAVDTTRNLLDYMRRKNVKSFVFISSLEYYGQNHDDAIISEEYLGHLDMTSPRSSYPLAKRSAEFLCSMYAREYGMAAKVARLTQTFGAGVASDDNRVFAQFARSIKDGRDIVLHTTGESAKPYCYTTDCVSAILHIMLKGQKGEAYNVANDDTYISIRDMAELLRRQFNPAVRVIIEQHPEMGYAPVTRLHLSSEKLRALGWSPRYSLVEMFSRLIQSL